MDSRPKCSLCSRSSNGSYSCDHTFCAKCFSQSLILEHLSDLQSKEIIQMKCKCNLGTVELSLADILEILKAGIQANPKHFCIRHKIQTEVFCKECKKWVCPHCISIHNDFNTKHTLIEEETPSEFSKCLIHPTGFNHLYCKDCNRAICSLCIVTASQHYGHNYESISDYASSLRQTAQLPQKSYEEFLKEFDQNSTEVNERLETYVKRTYGQLQEMKRAIEMLIEKFTQQMDTIYLRVNLSNEIIKFLASNYYTEMKRFATTLDIPFLRSIFACKFDSIAIGISFPDDITPELQSLTKKIVELQNVPIQPQAKVNTITTTTTITTNISPSINIIQENAKKNTFEISHTLLRDEISGVYSILQLNDRRLVSGGYSGELILWTEQEEIFRLKFYLPTAHSDTINSLIQLKDGRVASGSSDTSIKLWNVNKDELEWQSTLIGSISPVYCVLQLKNEKLAASSNGVIRIWSLEERIPTNTSLTLQRNYIKGLIQLRDEKIVSAANDKTIMVWTQIGDNEYECYTKRSITSSLVSLLQLSDGRIISGCTTGSIHFFILNEDSTLMYFSSVPGHERTVHSLLQLKDGRLATGSADKTIKIWEIINSDLRCTHTLTQHHHAVFCLIQLDDGRMISGSADKSIIVWN